MATLPGCSILLIYVVTTHTYIIHTSRSGLSHSELVTRSRLALIETKIEGIPQIFYNAD